MLKNSSLAQRLHGRLTAEEHRQGLLLWIVVIGAAVTFFLNILVDNAVVFHDEYVYKASADRMLDQPTLLQRGLIEYIPNRLFVAVYGLASLARQNYYVAAQFINVVFWALGVLLVARLGHMLGLRGPRLLSLAVVAIVLPVSVYTKYFMPEAMYFFLFALAAWLLFRGLASGSGRFIAAAGMAAGLAYYVKPHAVIFAGATILFLLLVHGQFRLKLRLPLYYLLGFAAVVAIGTLVIVKPQQLSRLGIYDTMLKNLLATARALFDAPGKTVSTVATVATGHVVLLLALWGGGTVAALAGVGAVTRLNALPPAERNRRWFGMWLVLTCACLLAVIIGFTVLVGEVGRIHTRYYCFLFPFLVLALLAYTPEHTSLWAKRMISVVTVLAAVALLFADRYAPALGISLVSDGPELGFAFYSMRAVFWLVLLLTVAQLAALWRNPKLLAVALACCCVASQFYARSAQGGVFRGPYTDGRDAVLAQQMLGPEGFRNAVVLADNRDAMSKFLFNVSATPNIRIQALDKATVETALRDYPAASAYFLLTDNVDGLTGLACEHYGERVFRCKKN
jgi:phosphoglycerol transferase